MLKMMKQFFTVCLIFIVICFLGCLIGTGILSVQTDSFVFIIGKSLPALSAVVVWRGICMSLPVVVFIAPILLSFYCLRKKFTGPRIAAYIVCSVVSWLVLLPLATMISVSSVKYNVLLPQAGSNVSEGYLREIDDSIVYYSHISADGRGDGIIIQPTLIETGQKAIIPLDAVQAVSGKPFPYADILIQQFIQQPGLLSEMQNITAELYQALCIAQSNGWTEWFIFASLFLAFLALPCLGGISRWPLLSIVFITLGGGLVCFVNVMLISPSSLVVVRNFAFFENLLLSATPLVRVLINVCLCMLFVLCGVISSFVHSEPTASYDGVSK